MKVFLDSYAMVEILEGNPAFLPYLREGITNPFNLLEFHVQACRLRDEADADAALARLRTKTIAIDHDDVMAASHFRRNKARKGVSYADALGYAMAQRRRIPFATGDKAFKGLPGVVP